MSNFYNQASWVLVPSGIEEDIVFAQKPISGLGDLTFTRSSDATFTDSTGVVRRSPWNLVQQSEAFDNAAWTKSATTVGINTTVAPNGTLTADSIIEDTANALHQCNQTTSNIGGTYTASVYVKPNGRDWVILNIAAAANYGAWFDVQNGVVGTIQSNITSATITAVGNGWYRCVIVANTAALSPRISLTLVTGNNVTSYTGNGTSGIFAWGAQLVEGSSALDYFPTTNRQDVPRIDFRNADGTLSSCGRLLLEPQRTNSFTFSENINNFSTLGRLNCGYTLGSSFGGFATSCLVTSTSFTGNLIRAVLVFNSIDTENNYFTIRVKKKSAWYLNVVSANGCALGDLKINLASGGGYISSSGTMLTDYKVVEFGEYFEIGFKTTQNFTTAAGLVYLNLYDNASFANYNDAGGTTFNISGIQRENQQTYGTSYIPTSGAAVTRLADVANKTGVSSLIGQTEGTLFAEFAIKTVSDARRILCISDGSISNRVVLAIESSNQFRVLITNGGVQQFSSLVSATNGTNKLAVSYKANDFSFYLNGVQISTQLSGSVPLCSDVYLGKIETSASSLILADGIAQAAIFKTRLTNAQLAQLTTL